MTDLNKLIQVVVSIDQLEHASALEISNHTGIPVSTVKKHITLARKFFKMDISYVQGKSALGEKGFYMIIEWGMLNHNRVLLEYG